MARTPRLALAALVLALLWPPAALAGGVHQHLATEAGDMPVRLPSAPRLAAPPIAPAWCGTPTTTDSNANEHGTDAAHVKVLYAYPSDRADRFAAVATELQGHVKAAQDAVVTESGGQRHLRVDMGTSCGRDHVDIQTVALPGTAASYATIGDPMARMSALKTGLAPALGGGGVRNYLVFLDGILVLPGGVADQPPVFFADAGGQFAMIFGDGQPAGFTSQPAYTRVGVLHELWHTFGAVVGTAPNHDAANPGHCDDGYDVLCYPLGGPCAGDQFTLRLDCGKDDYFSPTGLSWNTGHALVNTYNSPFLVRETAAATTSPPPTTTTPPPTTDPPVIVAPPRPAVSRLGIAPRRIRRGRSATVTLSLNTPAPVTFTVDRRTAGRRVGRRCVTNRRRGRRCVTWVRRPGSFSQPGKAGANTVRFTGRLRGRLLPTGSYRLEATPAGGAAVRVAFTIVRR